MPGFAGRAFLYRIATNACLQLGQRRQIALDAHPASASVQALGEPVTEAVWLEPFPMSMLGWSASTPDPATHVETLECIELAFVAAFLIPWFTPGSGSLQG